MAAIAGRNRAVRRLEPAVKLLAHNVAVGTGFRVIGEVGPALGIGESINADAKGNANNYPKQDALDRARFHLCFRFPTIDRSQSKGRCQSSALVFQNDLSRARTYFTAVHVLSGLNFVIDWAMDAVLGPRFF